MIFLCSSLLRRNEGFVGNFCGRFFLFVRHNRNLLHSLEVISSSNLVALVTISR